VLPRAEPLIGVLVVLTARYRWNELAWPLVALRDPDLCTLPVGLALLQRQHGTDHPTLRGRRAAVGPAGPGGPGVLALLVVARRWFVAGLARGGLELRQVVVGASPGRVTSGRPLTTMSPG